MAFLLPRDLAEKLEEFARGEGATLFMVLLAGFSALLARYAGQTDLVIGTPIAGRSRTELEGIVGLFVNTLALRCDLDGDPDFRTLVERTRTLALDAYAHQDTPFEQIVADLQPTRDLGRTPIFQVMLELHNEPTAALALPALTLTPLDAHTGAAKFDLSLALTRTPAGLASQLEYRTDLFAPETATRLVDHLTRLLAAAVENPARPLSRIDLRGDEERQALATVNATDRDFGPVTCIHHRISAQARRTPEAIAVEFEDQALSYRELEARTNQLAHHLRRQGVGPEALVGVCAERSLELVVALLGVLKAGAAYVPLDPELPPDRLRMMAEDAGVEVVLTQARHTGRVIAPVIIRLDADWATVARESVEPLADGAALDNLAYVIFTSGSTGRPKGAMNTHAGIDNRLQWMQAAYELGPDDRVLQKTPYSFDVSVWEFFWPLLVGARLVVARPGVRQDPAYLVDVIDRRGITTLHFVPSMLQAFLDAPDIARCTSLKRVICSGEALTPEPPGPRALAAPGRALQPLRSHRSGDRRVSLDLLGRAGAHDRADRPADRQHPAPRRRSSLPAATSRRPRRALHRRRRARTRLFRTTGLDGRAIHPRPVRRWRTHVPHRGPRARARRRRDRVPRATRLPGQDPRRAHRARRDRSRPDRSPGREGCGCRGVARPGRGAAPVRVYRR